MSNNTTDRLAELERRIAAMERQQRERLDTISDALADLHSLLAEEAARRQRLRREAVSMIEGLPAEWRRAGLHVVPGGDAS